MTPDPAQTARGTLIVLSGPSGVGKSTIKDEVIGRLGAWFSVSMTTRPKTEADTEGVDYFFVTPERFREAIHGGAMLEWEEVYDDRFYGTPREPVESRLAGGGDVILEVDVKGGTQVKAVISEALMIFIDPPDEASLLKRLRDRGREDEQEIQKRFAEAKREIEQAHSTGVYEHFVVNDDLSRAIDAVETVVRQRKAN